VLLDRVAELDVHGGSHRPQIGHRAGCGRGRTRFGRDGRPTDATEPDGRS
jgi:hypothetical protein